MSLHTNIPTRDQVDQLFNSQHPASVAIYLPTDPTSSGQAEQIALKNLVSEAVNQLTETGIPKREIASLEEEFSDLIEDTEFWRFQARTLAIFATPESLVSYQLPNRLVEMVAVADRFHLKPLLRAITFPQVAFVLALAQGSVRLLEVLPEGGPAEVEEADLPADVTDAVRIVQVSDRMPRGKTQSSQAEKAHLRQYCRSIDQSLRSVLSGRDVPLILAATDPLDSIYRSVNTYPHLAKTTISGNPQRTSDGELAAQARTILDKIYQEQLEDLHQVFDRRLSEGRAGVDVANTARSATFGMVDTLFVDIDSVLPGSVAEDGSVEFSDTDDAVAYGVVDEIARRVWLNGGKVLAVRGEDVPGGNQLAAILRYSF